jgi:hypothetical protein
VEVNNTVFETVLGQQLELAVNVGRQRAFSATDNDRVEE